MHEQQGPDDSVFEEVYLRDAPGTEPSIDINDLGDALADHPLVDVLTLATGDEANNFDFSGKTKTHDKVRFARADTIGQLVYLFDGDVKAMDSDSREHFDILEIDRDSICWLTARRK